MTDVTGFNGGVIWPVTTLDLADFNNLLFSFGTGTPTSTAWSTINGARTYRFTGFGFAAFEDGIPTTGTVTGYSIAVGSSQVISLSNFSIALEDLFVVLALGTPEDIAAVLLAGDDTLTGTNANDYLGDYGGSDVLSGNGGNDTLITNSGADTLDGGSGFDLFIFDRPSTTVSYTFAVADMITAAGGTLVDGSVIRNVEIVDIRAGSGEDTLDLGQAMSATSSFAGGLFYGGLGTDTLAADFSAAARAISLTLANNGLDIELRYVGDVPPLMRLSALERLNVIGSPFDDVFQGGPGPQNTINGADGSDSVTSRSAGDQLDGGADNDSLFLVRLNSSFSFSIAGIGSGMTLADGTVIRNFEYSHVTTGSFNDTFDFTGATSDAHFFAGGGVDRIVYAYAGAGTVYVTSSELGAPDANNQFLMLLRFNSVEEFYITTGAGNDQLQGGTGDDVLSAGAGSDHLTGNTGNDNLSGGDGIDFLNGNDGDDILRGGEGDDVIIGHAGTNLLFGDNGADALSSMSAGDVLDGGDGVDTATLLREAPGNSTIDLRSLWTSTNFFDGTTLLNIESFKFFTGSGDHIFLVSTFFGDQNILGGGDGFDRIVADYSASLTRVDTSQTTSSPHPQWLTWNGARMQLTSIEALSIQGSQAGDTLTGGIFDDILIGNGGNDGIGGSDGNDVIQGGAGDDFIGGGSGIDTVLYSDATSSVSVSLALSTPQNTLGAGVDSISEIENLSGSAHNDTLRGSAAANALNGEAGDDTLDGGAGVDQLLGGAGDDTVFWDAGDDLANVLGGNGSDTLVFTSGAPPTSFDLAAHSFEAGEGRFTDAGGNPWATQTLHYNTAWQLDWERIVGDDGRRTDLDYDEAGAFFWTTKWADYNPGGQLEIEVLVHDGGVLDTLGYDPADAHDWDTAWVRYDTLNRVDTEAIGYDDGTLLTLDHDQAGAFNWTQDWLMYDSLDRVELEVITYDDGSRAVLDLDASDAFDWASMWWLFDSNGNQVAFSGVNDDGTVF